jgi:hypothetical protein
MTARPAFRRTVAALVAAFAVLGTAGASAAVLPAASHAADKKDLVTFGLGPGGQAYIDQRAFLTYAGSPGSQLLDRIAVYNQSNTPLDLLVYGTDASNSRTGSIDLKPRAEANTDMGSWLALGRAAAEGKSAADGRSMVLVHVPGQSRTKGIGRVLLPIDVIVPHWATPGDHSAAIVAALITKGNNPSSQNIELEQRVALKIYFRVAGQVRPGLSVKILRKEYVGGSGLGINGTLRVSYRIKNTGNVRLGAVSSLSTRGPFGIGHQSVAGQKVAELVPGGSADLTADVKDVWPTILGRVTATATAVAPPNGGAPHLKPVSDRTRFWAITWQEIVLLLLIVSWLLYRRWRRAHAPRGKHVKDTPSRAKTAAKAGATVVLLIGVVIIGAASQTRARAADLGQLEVAPLKGTDSTLFNGYIQASHCPAGTSDSYWTVDGPDLPRDTAFLAPGNRTGTGPQKFRSAAISNLRTVNAGAFSRSGTYFIRFSCVPANGKVKDSYEVELRYHAGGQGSFEVRGAKLIPAKVLDPTYGTPAPAAPAGASPGASSRPQSSTAGGAAPDSDPKASPSPASGNGRQENNTASRSSQDDGSGLGWWVALLGLIPLTAGGVLLFRRSSS